MTGMARLLLFAMALGLLGCPAPVPEGDVEPNFLRLQGFVSVDVDATTLQGFLRWIYVAADPIEFEEPRTDCEIWEYLDLVAIEPDPACGDCTHQFDGTAEVQGEPDTTCTGVEWSNREFSLAFGGMDLVDEPDRTTLSEQGYTFGVQTRWSPDLGASEGFQPLFVAESDAWAPDDGEAGSTDELDGQYHLYCRYFWDLR